MRDRAHEYDTLAIHLRSNPVLRRDAKADIADTFEDAAFIALMADYYTRPASEDGPNDLTDGERLERIRAILFGDEQYVAAEEIDPDAVVVASAVDDDYEIYTLS
jgi:hypothetical protein